MFQLARNVVQLLYVLFGMDTIIESKLKPFFHFFALSECQKMPKSVFTPFPSTLNPFQQHFDMWEIVAWIATSSTKSSQSQSGIVV